MFTLKTFEVLLQNFLLQKIIHRWLRLRNGSKLLYKEGEVEHLYKWCLASFHSWTANFAALNLLHPGVI